MKLRHAISYLALVATPVMTIAQSAPSVHAEPISRNLVMMTRAGPNFADRAKYAEEARAHQAIYHQLADNGTTIASGAFEGLPFLGMTIWSSGIDEARARELIKEDKLPALGIVTYEFRMLAVREGSFGR